MKKTSSVLHHIPLLILRLIGAAHFMVVHVPAFLTWGGLSIQTQFQCLPLHRTQTGDLSARRALRNWNLSSISISYSGPRSNLTETSYSVYQTLTCFHAMTIGRGCMTSSIRYINCRHQDSWYN